MCLLSEARELAMPLLDWHGLWNVERELDGSATLEIYWKEYQRRNCEAESVVIASNLF